MESIIIHIAALLVKGDARIDFDSKKTVRILSKINCFFFGETNEQKYPFTVRFEGGYTRFQRSYKCQEKW